MRSDPAAITARGLSKRYRLGERGPAYRTLRESLAGSLSRSQRPAGREEAFWALRDVSFDVAPGEAVGVIGRNGAGKSTLLKILSRITPPTEGEAVIRGRIGSLLEVGTGFHPELTGRENIFLSGAILGMRAAEIRRRFDEIVAFAGLDRFTDTPVKRYSSGMYVRLAFAVAAHLEPEILLVDEVLAVGDLEFQKKCLGKMDDVSRSGRTVLFVSHSMGTIERLCTRSILLRDGRVAAFGSTADVVREYVASGGGEALSWVRSAAAPANGDDAPYLRRIEVVDADGRPVSAVTSASAVGIAIECVLPRPRSGLQLGLSIEDDRGQTIFSTGPRDSGEPWPSTAGAHRYVAQLPPAIFMPRRYGVSVSLYDLGGAVDLRAGALTIDVAPVASLANSVDGGRPGVLQLACTWRKEEAVSGVAAG
jgi:lipopolysaccharide transport system ATP-binding protein